MAEKATLRVVTDDDQPTTKAPRRTAKSKTVAQAAKNGTRLELLEAMRDRIASALSKTDCPTKDLSPLTRRLQELERDIESAKAEKTDPSVDPDDDDEVDDTFDPEDL